MPTLRTVGGKDGVAQGNVNVTENPPPAADNNGEGTETSCEQMACSPEVLNAVDKDDIDNGDLSSYTIPDAHKHIAKESIAKQNDCSENQHAVIGAERSKPKNKEPEKNEKDYTKLKSKGKASAYCGVYKTKGHSKYAAYTSVDQKSFYMGRWTLSADAALAYDEGTKVVSGKRGRRLNFATHKKYIEARREEMKKLGVEVHFNSKIASRDKVSKTIKGHIDAMKAKLDSTSAVDSASKNHATSAGNSKYIPVEKRKSINDTVHPEVHAKKKRKRQHKSNSKVSKKLNSKLNEMTDALTKKWGPFFVEDSSLANCMESLQRDITMMLAKNTSSSDHDPMSIESVSSLHSEERSATHLNTTDEIASDSSELNIATGPPAAIEEANVTVTTMISMPEALYASFDKEVANESGVEQFTNSVECAQSSSCTMEDNFGTLPGDKQCTDEDPPNSAQKSTEQVATSNGCAQSITSDKDCSTDSLFDDEGSIENNVTEEKDVDPKANIENSTEDICCDAHPSTATQSSNVPKSTRASVDVNECDLIPLNPGQAPFPIGCPVWSNFTTMSGGATFQCGTIVCASFNFVNRQLYYKVKLNDGNTVWFNELAFGPTCPIYYYPTNMADNESGIPGEVMFVSRLENLIYQYTVIVSSNDSGKYKVIEDIPASQIKYRNEAEVKSQALLQSKIKD